MAGPIFIEVKPSHPPDDDESKKKTDALRSPYGDVEVIELDKSGHPMRHWLHTANGRVLPVQSKEDSAGFLSKSLGQWRATVLDSFLPVGFPYSVSRDYLRYQMFDSLQAFFSTISSLLASRALLQGLGVGDGSSSATYAMLLTILKDANSRIATIFFAHRFGLRIEPDAKKYRFLADLFNDSAFFLELYTPYLGSWGKVIALSAGEALRALCSVAAGASKAALSAHFAKQDNLAELNAKEASQETAVGLIGLLVGTFIVKRIEDHTSVVYLMILLVFAHLGMNYLGVRSVCMNTLNRQRATILFQEYLRSGQVLTPVELAKRESIIFWDPLVRGLRGNFTARIEFAESYGQATSHRGPCSEKYTMHNNMHTKFLYKPAQEGQPAYFKMLLWHGAEPIDAIRAWLEAVQLTEEYDILTLNYEKKLATELELCRRRRANPDLWETLAKKGWDLRTQGLETQAPVRLQFIQKVAKRE